MIVASFNIHTYRSRSNGARSLLNIPDARGMTPLHYACSGNNKELVKKLLEKGADRKARYFTVWCSKMVDGVITIRFLNTLS